MMVLLALTLGWLACVVYSTVPAFWLLIHSRTEFWRSWRRLALSRADSAMDGHVGLVALVTWPFANLASVQDPWTWLPAAALFALGIWIYSQSRRRLQPEATGRTVPKSQANHPEQRLVTTGIRAHVRHPVYLGHLCEMLAWSIGTGLVVCYALTAFAIVTGAVMIHAEDYELGNASARNSARTSSVPAVIPSLADL